MTSEEILEEIKDLQEQYQEQLIREQEGRKIKSIDKYVVLEDILNFNDFYDTIENSRFINDKEGAEYITRTSILNSLEPTLKFLIKDEVITVTTYEDDSMVLECSEGIRSEMDEYFMDSLQSSLKKIEEVI